MRLFLTTNLICICIAAGYSQTNLHTVQYTTQSGMLSNTTYYGLFDRDNFLWICQNHGLSRFDGTHFTNFTVEDGLPDNDIIYVTEDSTGTIWAQPFQREPAFLKKNAVRFQTIRTIIHPDTVKKDQSYRVFPLRDGKVGLISENGVIRIIQHNRLLTSYFLRSRFPGIYLHYHNAFLYETHDKKMILFCSLNKFTFDLTQRTVKQEPFYGYLRVESFGEWICFQSVLNGPPLLCLNSRTGEQISIPLTRSVHRFGVFKTGVLINPEEASLLFFDFKTRKVVELPEHVILAHATENKAGDVRVLFSADNGIRVQNQPSGTEEQFQGKIPGFFHLQKNQLYVSDFIGNLLNLPDGSVRNITAGTYDVGVFSEQVNGKDLVYGNSTIIISNPDELIYDAANMMGVKAVSILNDSIRYVATRKGAFWFNNKTRKAKLLYLGRSTAISPGPNGSVFIGTIQGLIERTASGELINWSDAGTFNPIRITDLSFRNGILWVATAGEGLSAVYNGKAHLILNAENGTSRNHIETIEASDNGQLYIGYINGAQQLSYTFSGGKLHIEDLTELPVLRGEGIRNFFFHADTMYGLSTNSLYRFDTRTKIPVRSFQLQITRVLLNKTAQTIQPRTALAPGKYDLQVEFSTQNYQRLPVRYRYRVNTGNWIYVSDGSLSLDQLGSGNYRITIQVLNNYNRPSDSHTLTISIAYPFYVQNWFLIATGFCLIILLYLLVRYFTKRHYQKLNDELLQQNKLRELELVALKAQINPHFVFNCLNSIKSLMYQKRIGEADRYIDRFATLFRNTLEASFERNYPLSSEISYLQAYLEIEQLSSNNGFNFEFILSPSLDPERIFIPAMLLQPHVENAVKHGVSARNDKQGLITVSFNLQGERLVCTVRDNGPGSVRQPLPKESHLHTGKGISITEKRAQLYAIDTAFIEHATGGRSVILTLQITLQHDSSACY